MTKEQRRDTLQKRVHELAKLDPFVICQLQGMDFKLEFDNTAIKRILEELQINLLKEGGIPPGVYESPEDLAKVFFIGVQKHHGPHVQTVRSADDTSPIMTIQKPEELDQYLGMKHQGYIMRCLADASQSYFPDVSDLGPIEGDAKEGGEDPK